MAYDLEGKLGVWINDTSTALGQVAHLKQLGFDYLVARLVRKTANGFVATQVQNLRALIQEAEALDIPVFGWYYAYPTNIAGQITAVSGAMPAQCDHLFLDVEAEWESVPQGAALAHQLAHGIAETTGHRAQLQLSTHYYLSHHPIPATAFLAHCQGLMPQVYQVPTDSGGLTSVNTVIQRTLQDDPPLARQSLGGLLIATVNRPSMLDAVTAQSALFHAANVWLWDGDGGALPEDPGVRGREDDWAAAIAGYKAVFTPEAVVPPPPAPPATIERRVKTDSLNLRRTPGVEVNNILAVLPIGQAVTLTGDEQDGWLPIATKKEGVELAGFVRATLLREPASPTREALIQYAIQEWYRFGKGDHKETESPYSARVGDYWEALGENLDGNDTGVPWSAAFLSFIVRKAGYGAAFLYAASHSEYVRDCLRRRTIGDPTAGFWTMGLQEVQPQIGDIVCKRRGTTPPIRLDRFPSGHFDSHCDLIVEVQDSLVRTIGGNVGNSVSMTEYRRDASGFVSSADRVYALLQNRR